MAARHQPHRAWDSQAQDAFLARMLRCVRRRLRRHIIIARLPLLVRRAEVHRRLSRKLNERRLPMPKKCAARSAAARAWQCSAHLERGVCAVVSVIVPQTQMISLGHVCGVVPLRRRRAVPRSPPRLAVPAGKLLETVSPVLAFLRIRKEVAVAARASPGPLSAPTLVTAHGARAWVDGVAHARDPAACASAHARLPPVCALGAPCKPKLPTLGKKGRNLPRTSLPAVVNRHHVRCTSYCCDPAAPQSTNSKPILFNSRLCVWQGRRN